MAHQKTACLRLFRSVCPSGTSARKSRTSRSGMCLEFLFFRSIPVRTLMDGSRPTCDRGPCDRPCPCSPTHGADERRGPGCAGGDRARSSPMTPARLSTICFLKSSAAARAAQELRSTRRHGRGRVAEFQLHRTNVQSPLAVVSIFCQFLCRRRNDIPYRSGPKIGASSRRPRNCR